MADVLLHPDVNDWLESQNDKLENRFRQKLEDAGDNPGHFLSGLTGRDTYKLRVGDYRAEIEWDKQADELRVIDAGHRDGFWG